MIAKEKHLCNIVCRDPPLLATPFSVACTVNGNIYEKYIFATHLNSLTKMVTYLY